MLESPLLQGMEELKNTMVLRNKDFNPCDKDLVINHIKTDAENYFGTVSLGAVSEPMMIHFSARTKTFYLIRQAYDDEGNSKFSLEVFDVRTSKVENSVPIQEVVTGLTGNQSHLFMSTDSGVLLICKYSSIKTLKKVNLFHNWFKIYGSVDDGVWIIRKDYMYFYNHSEKKLTKNSCQLRTGMVEVSSDGQLIAIQCARASNDEGFKIYSVLLKFPEVYIQVNYQLESLKFSLDCMYLAASFNNSIKIYSTSTWEVANELKLTDSGSSLAFWDMNLFFCCGSELKIWNILDNNKEIEYTIELKDINPGEIIIDYSESVAYLVNYANGGINKLYLPYSKQNLISPLVAGYSFAVNEFSGLGYSIKSDSLVQVDFNAIKVTELTSKSISNVNCGPESLCQTLSFIYYISRKKFCKLRINDLEIVSEREINYNNPQLFQANGAIYLLAENVLEIHQEYSNEFEVIILKEFTPKFIAVHNLNTIALAMDEYVVIVNKHLVSQQYRVGSDPVIKLFFLDENNLLVLTNSSAKIFTINPWAMFKPFKFNMEVTDAILTEKKNALFTASEKNVYGYFIPEFIQFSCIKIKSASRKIYFADNEKYIIVLCNSLPEENDEEEVQSNESREPIPENDHGEKSEEAPAEMPEETPAEIPEETPAEMPEETPAEMPAELPEENPEGTPADMPEKIMMGNAYSPEVSVQMQHEEGFEDHSEGENSILRIENPLIARFTISTQKNDYQRMMNCITGNLKNFDKEKDSWFIHPSNYNCVHFFVFHNQSALLEEALAQGCAFITSANGDPLSIALKMNYRECVDVILRSLRNRITNDLFAVQCIQDKIPLLHAGSYKGLDELYDCCFLIDNLSDLPRFCSESTSLPKLRLSLSIACDGFLNDTELREPSVRINYYVSTLAVNFNAGSKESIDFLESLKECENTDVYKTKFIQTVLDLKWKKVLVYVAIQNAIYMLYLASIVVYILDGEKEKFYLMFALIINIPLMIYEVLQLKSNGLQYFKDSLNIIDISRNTLLLIFVAFVYFDIYRDQDWILFTLSSISFMRGITVFRLFKNTRYMVSLLFEVVLSMVAFSIVLGYAVFAFAVLLMTIEGDNNTLPQNLSVIYQMLLGGASVDDNWGVLNWVIFICSTILGLIIMMNLLISLLSDTYSAVQESAEIEDLKQLIELILEIEYAFYWNSTKTDKHYIQVCDKYSLKLPGNLIEKKLLKIKTLNKSLIKKTEDQDKALEIIKTTLDNKTEELSSQNVRHKKELENLLIDLKLQIKNLSDSGTKDIEKVYEPICLKGHNMQEGDRSSSASCDLCRKAIKVAAFVCYDCDFDMCRDCYNWNFNSKLYDSSKCLYGHDIRETKLDALCKENKFQFPFTCRNCNEEFSRDQSIYYCRYCAYGFCVNCKEIIDKTNNLDKRPKCPLNHELKWITEELYNNHVYILNCKICESKFAGAGFFACTSCQHYICTGCIKNKYL